MFDGVDTPRGVIAVGGTAAGATALAQVALLQTTDPLVLGAAFVVAVLGVVFFFVLLPRLFW